MIKICQECGNEFETKNGNARFCNKDHYRECVICGEVFYVPKSKLGEKPPKTCCSKKCSIEKRKQTNQSRYGGNAPASSKEVREKAKATTLERYGVEYGSQSEIAKAKSKKTSLERYGVEHHTQRDSFRDHMRDLWSDEEFKSSQTEKSKEAIREIYGVANVFSLSEIREKSKKTYQESTGYSHPSQNPECITRRQNTNLERYGSTSPLGNAEVFERFKKTNMKRYGVDNPMKDSQVKKKAEETCKLHYGNSCYLASPEGRAAIAKSMYQKYQSRYFSQTAEFKKSVMSNPECIDKFVQFDKDPKLYILSKFDYKPTLRELCEDLGVGTEAISTRVNRDDCSDLIAYVYSYTELEVLEFLKSLNLNTKIITNTKSVITPYELDIYLSEYNLAIEVNPTSTHNSSINTFSEDSKPLAPSYHKMKTDLCEEKGIFLFHIFGYEWTHRKDVIKSMIRNLLQVNESNIFARKCEIKEVSYQDASIFLDNNHRQGSTTSPIRVGLYYNDELVSLMTFSHSRSTIGKVEKSHNCYELVRFCSKKNTNVLGGASRLFKHFLKTYHPKSVISFSDRAHTRGKLYKALGFKEISRSSANYLWVQYNTDMSYHRTNAQKRNLKKFLKDDLIDLSKTEKQIMEEHNFVQVFDSGTITWAWYS